MKKKVASYKLFLNLTKLAKNTFQNFIFEKITLRIKNDFIHRYWSQ